ncbi:hypothetical protein MMC25_005243 [Agyrium rufum]|nr:hypothetical protein [Agyrium rufum]
MGSIENLPAQKMHVLIIGAGCSGLILAHGLKKVTRIPLSYFCTRRILIHSRLASNIPSSNKSQALASGRENGPWAFTYVTTTESDEVSPPMSFNSPNPTTWSYPMLEKLLADDLIPRMAEAQNDPWQVPQDKTLPIYNGIDGTIMKDVPSPRGTRVSRRKMRALCAEGIDVKYEHKLSNIVYDEDGSVTAEFENGVKASGSIIVGADGPRSSVRKILIGEKADVTALDVIHTNVVIRYGDAEKARHVRSAHDEFAVCAHPDCFCIISISDVPDPEKPEDWKFQVVTSWRGEKDPNMTNSERLAEVKKKASVLAEPFRSAVEWMPEDTPVTYDPIAFWEPLPWNNHGGRVTLAGDAAHPMTPHRGQGLNHAICDVSKFVETLRKVITGDEKLSEAISEYDTEIRKRGGDEVVASKQSAYMMLDWNTLMEAPLMKSGIDREDLRAQAAAIKAK